MTYHNYIFFTADKRINDLPEKKLNIYKNEFADEITSTKDVVVFPYTTLGLKANTLFFFWLQADSPQTLQDYLSTLMHTALGKLFIITHTLFGMSRPSQYATVAVNHLDTARKGGEY